MAVVALLAQTHYVYRFILKGFDIQRQQAGILREGAEGTRGQEEGAHICFTAQSGSGIPRSPYQDENELLRSSF